MSGVRGIILEAKTGLCTIHTMRSAGGAAGARGQGDSAVRAGRASVAQRTLYCKYVGWRRASPSRASVVSQRWARSVSRFLRSDVNHGSQLGR